MNSNTNVEPVDGNQESLPSQEQLALLAAASRIKDPIKAVEYALTIWREAGRILAANYQALARRGLEKIPTPPEFPASLNDFLKLVVGTRTLADATKRFRDFYRQTLFKFSTGPRPRKRYSAEDPDPDGGPTIDPERWAEQAIQGWKECGFRTEYEWVELAQQYLAWWQRQKSQHARTSAQKHRGS